ncbi:hypothetical protein MRX96_038612 [Rhipicephalus microplus]
MVERGSGLRPAFLLLLPVAWLALKTGTCSAAILLNSARQWCSVCPPSGQPLGNRYAMSAFCCSFFTICCPILAFPDELRTLMSFELSPSTNQSESSVAGSWLNAESVGTAGAALSATRHTGKGRSGFSARRLTMSPPLFASSCSTTVDDTCPGMAGRGSSDALS